MNSKMQGAKAQSGFTLVEMAVVLVIIGLILGALSIGKDIVRNAEYQKVSTKFQGAWKKAYDEYYQRTGVVLGDSQTSPTYMVNGERALIAGATMSNGGNLSGALPGVPASFQNTGIRICHGQGYAANTVGQGDPGVEADPAGDLHNLYDRIGLRMPPGRGEGREDRYLYSDSNGNPAEVQICFQWNPDNTISGAGNVMVVRGLTPDLARFLDAQIDGKPDALEGRFRQQNNGINDGGEPSSQRPGIQWGTNNTVEFGDDPSALSAPLATGDNKDEDRVILVTAHWVMDQ